MATLIGNGKARSPICTDSLVACFDGSAEQQRLLSPVAAATAADGSVYVGDFDLIRKIRPDGTATTVLKMRSDTGSVSHRYHVTVRPGDGAVFVSDPEGHRILRLLSDEPKEKDVERNFEVRRDNF